MGAIQDPHSSSSSGKSFSNPPHWVAGTNDPNTISAYIGCFIVLYGFVSFVVKQKLFISESIVATAVGVIAGPYVLKVLDPFKWGDTLNFTYNFAQFICAIQIMAATIAVPRRFWKSRWSSVAILLGPVMTYEYVLTALIIWGILGIPFLDALIISACAAPTDPVLANAIINGRFADLHISPPVRYLLAAESAANDGLAIPMFMLPVLLLKDSSAGSAVGKWFYAVWVYEVLGAVFLGLIIGFIAQRLLQYAEMKRFVDKTNFLSFEIALGLFVIGLGSMLGTASFLAVFSAGLVFSWDDWFHEKTKDNHIQEVLDMLLNITFFIYFGSIMPWEQFNTPQIPFWKLFLTAIAVLIVRRLPIIFVLYRGLGGWFSYQEAFFVGWFGPVGVGALWYMAYAMLFFPDNPYFVPIVSFLVLSSVIIHGITVPFAHVTIMTARTVSVSRNSQINVPTWPANVPITTSVISGPIVQTREFVTTDTVTSNEESDQTVINGWFGKFIDNIVTVYDPFSSRAARARRNRRRAEAIRASARNSTNENQNTVVDLHDNANLKVSSDSKRDKGNDDNDESGMDTDEIAESLDDNYIDFEQSYGLPLSEDFSAGPPAGYMADQYYEEHTSSETLAANEPRESERRDSPEVVINVQTPSQTETSRQPQHEVETSIEPLLRPDQWPPLHSQNQSSTSVSAFPTSIIRGRSPFDSESEDSERNLLTIPSTILRDRSPSLSRLHARNDSVQSLSGSVKQDSPPIAKTVTFQEPDKSDTASIGGGNSGEARTGKSIMSSLFAKKSLLSSNSTSADSGSGSDGNGMGTGNESERETNN